VAIASRLAVGSSRKIIGGFLRIILQWQFSVADLRKVALHRDYNHPANPKSAREDKLLLLL
jgi:hypothetical protein